MPRVALTMPGGAGSLRGEAREQVEAAAQLEGADRGVVLVLHPHFAPGAASEQRPRVLRRRRHRRVDVTRGGLEFLKGYHRESSAARRAGGRAYCMNFM